MSSFKCQYPPERFRQAMEWFRTEMNKEILANGGKLSAVACSSCPPPPPPPRRDINKHIAKDFKKMFQRNSRNAENSLKYNLNCNSLKKFGTNFSTIV